MARKHHKTQSIIQIKGSPGSPEGDKTITELSEQFYAHPNQIMDWKRQLQENASSVFGQKLEKEKELNIRRMQAKIGNPYPGK